MCIRSHGCICHHLEKAIKQDDKKKLKVIFATVYIDELYDFLLDSYKLLQIEGYYKYVVSMNKLVKTYLLDKSPKSINVQNDQVKKDFMDLYDEKLDDLPAAKRLLHEKLSLLIQDVQHLAYQNLSHLDSFTNCLENVDQSNAMAVEDKKAHHRRGCLIL
ncbi:hypothetical protein OQJ13_14110 [Legionella sp. PATHC035]|uniref:hypothetical protein n=1 Tax=Legionella sp. PATHC035 TaxID=2992040 RepID=UPI002244E6CA|nr:hypothetical protein [Legionella sp. PATHC035]MCW8410110.1 hypothetical protein [Legionella sp. PATHC035]